MASRTSGKRNISAVPVVSSKPVGAITEGLGEGSEVRCGFCERAASNAVKDSGLVIRLISRLQRQRLQETSGRDVALRWVEANL